MIIEILTLTVDGLAVKYYIMFGKDRRKFSFQPTLKNKSAPTFTVLVDEGKFVTDQPVDSNLLDQAVKKIREVLSDDIFDRF